MEGYIRTDRLSNGRHRRVHRLSIRHRIDLNCTLHVLNPEPDPSPCTASSSSSVTRSSKRSSSRFTRCCSALGAAILIIFGLLPFFTLGEDTVMYKSVALDVILLLVLIATLFATSKSIYEEIEDRTMLTLMSKPVRKWEVLVGKYLGIIAGGAAGGGVWA